MSVVTKMQPHEAAHAKELEGQLKAEGAGDAALDLRISNFMGWPAIKNVTSSIDSAKECLKPDRQWGFKPNEDGTWSAFTETHIEGKASGFMYATHASQPRALAAAGMACRLLEDAPAPQGQI